MTTHRVLLVEDSRDDEFFTMRALGQAARARVEITRDGPEALRLLRRSARRGGFLTWWSWTSACRGWTAWRFCGESGRIASCVPFASSI